jgi:5-methylcytosine-specific restriction enzyme subunit McrC
LISDPHRRWVVDTKYKTPGSGPDAADVAQVLAYAQVAGAQDAVLVYPVPLAQPLDAIVQGIRLRTLTFAVDRDLDAAGADFVAALFRPPPQNHA